MEESQKNYWEKVREFNLSRTPFWISCLFQLFLTILPFIAIWILVGPDFKDQNFNFYQSLLNPQVGYLFLFVFGFLIYAVFLTAITWLFHWQKADTFTYTFGLTFVFMSIILNGIWMIDWKFDELIVRLLVRFVIGLVAGLLGVLIGVIITTFARNSDYKMEEKNYEMVMDYRDKKDLDPSVLMEQTTVDLDEILVKKYDEHQTKLKIAKANKKAKLDAKETKKRQKDQKKRTDFVE